jgi:hypothetical protein
MSFQLTSSAFAAGQPIPAQYTCRGKDIWPPLNWSAPPTATRSLALISTIPMRQPAIGCTGSSSTCPPMFDRCRRHTYRRSAAGRQPPGSQRLATDGLPGAMPTVWHPPLLLQTLRAGRAAQPGGRCGQAAAVSVFEKCQDPPPRHQVTENPVHFSWRLGDLVVDYKHALKGDARPHPGAGRADGDGTQVTNMWLQETHWRSPHT